MAKETPTPKPFKATKYKKLISKLNQNTPSLEFEEACKPIVFDILENYEKFKRVEEGPSYRGTPFDFFGFKKGAPFIIEFKGSLNSFHTPSETQKRRMKEIRRRIKGLNIALLQVALKKCQYRILYNEDMDALFHGKKAPIKPIADWIRERI